jgi:hypothetical protein
MNEYQTRDFNQAQAIAAAVNAVYPASRGVAAATHATNTDSDFWARCILKTANGNQYLIHKDYHGHFTVSRYPYATYPHVSSEKQRDTRNAIETSNNIGVLTEKKLQTKIDEEDATAKALEALEADCLAKHEAFRKELIASGFLIKWHTYNDDTMTRGTITCNGLHFEFEMMKDGYISKKIDLHYSVDNTLEAFAALADNKYNHND